MRVSVGYHGATPNEQATFDLLPTDTVKSVKKRIIELAPPPSWANTSVLMVEGTKDYLDNKRTMRGIGVAEGSTLRFAYARKMTVEEKLNLCLKGVKMEDFEVPPMEISTMPDVV
eukprot:TRINITY_DN15382_c0_g1_i1.p1 TRINITY_DN15382_c0_g1~~TRINITY_DN15382_c0_g1_i1.p1  ORF type:complete len:135 (-),score=27.01 TRINITY_DN15382_c0_g1_i1:198-542(-)